ncbi:MAG TPA: arsenate reductase ArsC [Syntrophorhabdales bacterium]|nr:arsenate reductase ArsC [Syntrophorhabdales bacterium]
MKPAQQKQKVIFYCRCNATCSQMAEAFLRLFFPEGYEAYSAGMMAAEIHPAVKTVMAEIGVDMSGQRSKNVEEFVGTKFDCVALVCGDPPEKCPFLNRAREHLHCKGCQGCCRFFPFFPSGTKVLHTHFADPARFVSPGDETIEALRKLRDDIKDWVIETFG